VNIYTKYPKRELINMWRQKYYTTVLLYMPVPTATVEEQTVEGSLV
jgi:hypothetical protein